MEVSKTRIIDVPADYYLLAIYGPDMGMRYLLNISENDFVSIGRIKAVSEKHINVNEAADDCDHSVSRIHAMITKKNGILYIINKSKSGVFVNNQLIRNEIEYVLEIGDEIEIVSSKKSTIYRLVEKEKWDFSWPKKAGGILVANYPRMIYIVTILLILPAVLILLKLQPFKKNSIVRNQQNTKLVCNSRLWIPGEMFEENNGEAKQEYRNTYALAIGDIDGNGTVDIVIKNKRGNLIGLECTSLNYLWPRKRDVIVENGSGITLDDFDLNGIPDMFASCKGSHVAILDGSTGIPFARSNDEFLGGKLVGNPIVKDYDGNGYIDLSVISENGDIYTGFQYNDCFKWKKTSSKMKACSQMSVCNYGGKPLNVFGTGNGLIIGYNPLTEDMFQITDINQINNNGSIYPINQNGIACYSIDSLNVLFGLTTQQYKSFIINLSKGKIISTVIIPDTIDTIPNTAIPVFNDVNGDGFPDLILKYNSRTIAAYDGNPENAIQGKQIWSYSLTGNNSFTADIAIADFNNDQIGEIVTGDKKGHVYILDGKMGNALWYSETLAGEIVSNPLIGDVNKDGLLDIIIITNASQVHLLTTNNVVSKNEILWGQRYLDSKNSNSFSIKMNERSNAMLLRLTIICFCCSLIISGTGCLYHLYSVMKRRNNLIKTAEM